MRLPRFLVATTVAALAALAAACGKGPTAPTPTPISPVTQPPAITCPANVTAPTVNAAPVTVTYNAPTVTGGALPVTTTCSSASGSSFNLGTTEVSCSVVDGEQRQAACSFTVQIVEVPHVSKTRFLAFGDSITYGVSNEACQLAPSGEFARFVPFRLGSLAVVAQPYPSILRSLLQARYPAENPAVFPSGVPGELIVTGDGRLSGELNKYQPDAVLLLEGVNDIHATQGNAISDIREALRSMIRHTLERGAEAFVSTLLPQRIEGCKAYDWSDGVDDISDANATIIAVAGEFMGQTPGVTLVDMHKVFSGQESTLLGGDGLHPNETGYERMAAVFFDAIKAKLEP